MENILHDYLDIVDKKMDEKLTGCLPERIRERLKISWLLYGKVTTPILLSVQTGTYVCGLCGGRIYNNSITENFMSATCLNCGRMAIFF